MNRFVTLSELGEIYGIYRNSSHVAHTNQSSISFLHLSILLYSLSLVRGNAVESLQALLTISLYFVGISLLLRLVVHHFSLPPFGFALKWQIRFTKSN